MKKYVIKSSGEKELFDPEKFRRSLRHAGAKPAVIESLLESVKKNPQLKTTHQIYYFALQALKKHYRPLAARYNLKQALFELGPSGFPFEQYVGLLFSDEGYTVKYNVIENGWCVRHELDIIAQKGKQIHLIECKFHHSKGLKVAVKTTLYMQARFEDIQKKWEQHASKSQKLRPLIVTNTSFTTEAISYAACVDMDLLGWAYPKDTGLARRIDRAGLHPITSLTSLNRRQKRAIVQEGIVLCRDVAKKESLIRKAGITGKKLQETINEAQGVCELPP